MDKFPDHINLKSCKGQLITNEINLLKETREKFTEIIDNNITNICYVSTLVFDDRLCQDYKKKIIQELLERFGTLGITYESCIALASTTIYVNSDIPNNVKSIIVTIDKKH